MAGWLTVPDPEHLAISIMPIKEIDIHIIHLMLRLV